MRARLAAPLLALALAACGPSRAPRHDSPAPRPSSVPAAVSAARPMPEPVSRDAAPAAAATVQAQGPWRVAAVSVRTPEETAAYVQRLKAAGYRVEIEAVFSGGTGWQRVVLPGYATAAAARQVVTSVNALLPGASAWVLPRRKD